MVSKRYKKLPEKTNELSSQLIEKLIPVFELSTKVNSGSCEHRKKEKIKMKVVINFLIF